MTFDNAPGGTWEPRWVWKPAETHFVSGGTSPLAFGNRSSKLEGQARLGPRVELEDATLDKVALGVGIGVVLTLAAAKAAPALKRRLTELRSRMSRTGLASGAASESETAAVAVRSEITSEEFASEVDAALAERRPTISSAEAEQRLLAALMAAAFIADQMRALSNFQIGDDPDSRILEQTLEKLSTPQVIDSINRMIESESSLVDDETTSELMKLFGGGRVVEGEYVPIRNDAVRRRLRLSTGD